VLIAYSEYQLKIKESSRIYFRWGCFKNCQETVPSFCYQFLHI